MSKELKKVVENAVVTYSYQLRSGHGDLLESSPEGGAVCIHGSGDLVEGLEKALHKRKVGASFSVRLKPGEAYGEADPAPLTLDLPKSRFPAGFPVKVGSSIVLEGAGGEMFTMWVTGFEGDLAHLRDSHPYAGMELSYEVEVLSIREATEEELAQGLS